MSPLSINLYEGETLQVRATVRLIGQVPASEMRSHWLVSGILT
ncbi:hypothetical protein [Coleofasciculus sp. E2-BRE-01]